MSNVSRSVVCRSAIGIAISAGLAVLALNRAAGQPTSTETANPAPTVSVGKSNALTLEEFERLHKLIKPQPGEWRFMEIPWATSVGEARQKAAREGKPMLIWYMVGEPLGQC